jgi:hypothetical protein
MNKDELLKLVKSGELQPGGLGRTVTYQSLNSELSRNKLRKSC